MKNFICIVLCILSTSSYLFSSEGPTKDDFVTADNCLSAMRDFLIKKDYKKYTKWVNINSQQNILNQLHSGHLPHIDALISSPDYLTHAITSKVGSITDKKKADNINHEIKRTNLTMLYVLWWWLDDKGIKNKDGIKIDHGDLAGWSYTFAKHYMIRAKEELNAGGNVQYKEIEWKEKEHERLLPSNTRWKMVAGFFFLTTVALLYLKFYAGVKT